LVSEIQTNCYFSTDLKEWIKDNMSIVWASIDGPPELHNKYRKVPGDSNPAETVLNNAMSIMENTFVGVRCTIVPETVNHQVELIEYFDNLGFKYISSEPVFSPIKAGETCEEDD